MLDIHPILKWLINGEGVYAFSPRENFKSFLHFVIFFWGGGKDRSRK
jgi:hypothetical protein